MLFKSFAKLLKNVDDFFFHIIFLSKYSFMDVFLFFLLHVFFHLIVTEIGVHGYYLREIFQSDIVQMEIA